MGRSTHYQGLTEEAETFLKTNAKTYLYKFNNGWGECHVVKPLTEEIGHTGMFGEITINKYELKDGSYAEEYVQANPWHSGPVIFMGLKTKDRRFEWTEEEINSRI